MFDVPIGFELGLAVGGENRQDLGSAGTCRGDSSGRVLHGNALLGLEAESFSAELKGFRVWLSLRNVVGGDEVRIVPKPESGEASDRGLGSSRSDDCVVFAAKLPEDFRDAGIGYDLVVDLAAPFRDTLDLLLYIQMGGDERHGFFGATTVVESEYAIERRSGVRGPAFPERRVSAIGVDQRAVHVEQEALAQVHLPIASRTTAPDVGLDEGIEA